MCFCFEFVCYCVIVISPCDERVVTYRYVMHIYTILEYPNVRMYSAKKKEHNVIPVILKV